MYLIWTKRKLRASLRICLNRRDEKSLLIKDKGALTHHACGMVTCALRGYERSCVYGDIPFISQGNRS